MIYTSHFSALRRIPAVQSGELRALSIALCPPPQWPQDSQAFALRPWPYMVNQYQAGTLTVEKYEQAYREQILINVSPWWILQYYDNAVLCCFETPDKFCHRHIVRQWILEETGVQMCASNRRLLESTGTASGTGISRKQMHYDNRRDAHYHRARHTSPRSVARCRFTGVEANAF